MPLTLGSLLTNDYPRVLLGNPRGIVNHTSLVDHAPLDGCIRRVMEDLTMNAIRPVITLALLLALGAFLWHRISSPGLRPPSDDLQPIALSDGPPLGSATPHTGASAQDNSSSAPPFNVGSASANGGAPATELSPSTAAPALEPSPGVLPHLPPMPGEGTPEPNPEEDSAANRENNPSHNSIGIISGSVPSLGTSVNSTANATAESTIPAPAPTANELTPAPSVESALSAAEADMLAGATASPSASLPESPVGPAQEFNGPNPWDEAKPAIERALASGDLKEAHRLLTQWYGDRRLAPNDRDEVQSLLNQLAGTVVYSAEFPLEPPHTVAPGETLETIAQQYQVPWQLLAKINGIATSTGVTPGQSLKVIRGPFSAVVDVERQELALLVSDLYAGRFTVKTEGLAASEGEWTVSRKQVPADPTAPAKHVVLTGEMTPGNFSSIVIGTASVDSPEAMAGAIRVSPPDQEDLFDILSVGSKVIVRR